MRVHPKHLPADQRRSVTVEAIVELAAEQNPGEITTAAIAQRMHLTQGALFRHFANKEAIWRAAMEWVAEHLLHRLDQAARTARSPLAALEAMFAAHVEFVATHPGVPRMLLAELQRADDTPAKHLTRILIEQYAERLRALIDQGKAQGELDREVDTSAAVVLFIGTIQGLVMQSLLAGDAARLRADAPGAFAIYRRGIRRAP